MRRLTLLLGVLLLFSSAALAAPRDVSSPASASDSETAQNAPHSILLVGDSLSIGLGKQLERLFDERKDVVFSRRGKVSSGLARPDFFDWEKNLEDLAKTQRPDVVIIMIGANDNKSLTDKDGKNVYFDDPAWDGLYAEKAKRLFAICRSYNPDVRIYWVGAPIMGDPALSGDLERINGVLKKLCENESGCRWVDTWQSLADSQGAYAMYGKNGSGDLSPLRVEDGVHVTAAGARILARDCITAVAPDIGIDGDSLMADASCLTPAAKEDVAKAMASLETHESEGGKYADGKPYKVRRGESLWRIARRRGLEMERLLAYNPGLDPDDVRPGQTIALPPRKSRMAGVAEREGIKSRIADAKAAAASLHGEKYVVRQGDTFWAIAEKYNVSPMRIAMANPGANPKGLRPGMSLEIPAPAPGEPVVAAAPQETAAAPEPVSNGSGEAVKADAGPGTYAVADGDNFWNISERLRISHFALKAANPGVDPKKLKPGQVINLPEASLASAPAGKAGEAGDAPSRIASSPAETYLVADGDNFWDIARRFGVSVKDLRAANQGVNPKKLKPGQTLTIPERKSEITGIKNGKTGDVSLDNLNREEGSVAHRIDPGDTFWALSRRYGADMGAIIRANAELDPGRLTVGGVMFIPLYAFSSPAPFVALDDSASGADDAQVVVAEGDTLWDIASRRSLPMPALLAVNPGVDPVNMKIGQRINLPSKSDLAAYEQRRIEDALLSADASGSIQSYVAGYGDNLWTLSKRFGVSVETLARENGIDNPESIDAGRILRIPAKTVTLLSY